MPMTSYVNSDVIQLLKQNKKKKKKKKKKQIHDIGTEVYSHTYNNGKKERDRFIKKIKSLPTTFRVGGERSQTELQGQFVVPVAKNNYTLLSTCKQLQLIV